jgi:hypothetical protein
VFCDVAIQIFPDLLDSTSGEFKHAFNVDRLGGHVPFQFAEASGEGVNGFSERSH